LRGERRGDREFEKKLENRVYKSGNREKLEFGVYKSGNREFNGWKMEFGS